MINSNDSTAILTLDHLGKLMINSSGFGGDPFVIYSGGPTENTISATLLDTGNLVVREVNSNGSLLEGGCGKALIIPLTHSCLG